MPLAPLRDDETLLLVIICLQPDSAGIQHVGAPKKEPPLCEAGWTLYNNRSIVVRTAAEGAECVL